MSVGALIGGLAGGLMSSDASDKAAKKQSKAMDRATELEREMYQQSQAQQAPWRHAGQAALGRLTDIYGLGAETQAISADWAAQNQPQQSTPSLGGWGQKVFGIAEGLTEPVDPETVAQAEAILARPSMGFTQNLDRKDRIIRGMANATLTRDQQQQQWQAQQAQQAQQAPQFQDYQIQQWIQENPDHPRLQEVVNKFKGVI